jgi:hypothetical protein
MPLIIQLYERERKHIFKTRYILKRQELKRKQEINKQRQTEYYRSQYNNTVMKEMKEQSRCTNCSRGESDTEPTASSTHHHSSNAPAQVPSNPVQLSSSKNYSNFVNLSRITNPMFNNKPWKNNTTYAASKPPNTPMHNETTADTDPSAETDFDILKRSNAVNSLQGVEYNAENHMIIDLRSHHAAMFDYEEEGGVDPWTRANLNPTLSNRPLSASTKAIGTPRRFPEKATDTVLPPTQTLTMPVILTPVSHQKHGVTTTNKKYVIPVQPNLYSMSSNMISNAMRVHSDDAVNGGGNGNLLNRRAAGGQVRKPAGPLRTLFDTGNITIRPREIMNFTYSNTVYNFQNDPAVASVARAGADVYQPPVLPRKSASPGSSRLGRSKSFIMK